MKTSKFFFALCLCAGALSFASCGDDDPATGGGGTPGVGNGGSSSLAKDAGVLLTSVGGTNFVYDEQNRLVQYGGSYDKWKIDYANHKLVNTNYGSEREFSVGFSPAGFISAISGQYTYNEGSYYSERVTGNTGLTYDAAGHLTAITESGTEVYVEDGETETYTYTMSTALTWVGNNLVKAVVTGRDNEGWSYTSTYEITYGTQVNKYLQMPQVFVEYDLLCAEFVDEFTWAAAGLCGVGPANLPTSLTRKTIDVEDGETDTDEDGINLVYTLNDDGTIASEGISYFDSPSQIYPTYYGYTPVSATPNYPPASVMSTDKDKSQKFFTSKMRQRMQARRAARLAR